MYLYARDLNTLQILGHMPCGSIYTPERFWYARPETLPKNVFGNTGGTSKKKWYSNDGKMFCVSPGTSNFL